MTDVGIQKARGLLTAPAPRSGNAWAMLASAALAAMAAVAMAGVMVLGPGVRFDEPAAVQPLFPNG